MDRSETGRFWLRVWLSLRRSVRRKRFLDLLQYYLILEPINWRRLCFCTHALSRFARMFLTRVLNSSGGGKVSLAPSYQETISCLPSLRYFSISKSSIPKCDTYCGPIKIGRAHV